MEEDVGVRNNAYNRPPVGEWRAVRLVSQTQDLGTVREYRARAPKRASSPFP